MTRTPSCTRQLLAPTDSVNTRKQRSSKIASRELFPARHKRLTLRHGLVTMGYFRATLGRVRLPRHIPLRASVLAERDVRR